MGCAPSAHVSSKNKSSVDSRVLEAERVRQERLRVELKDLKAERVRWAADDRTASTEDARRVAQRRARHVPSTETYVRPQGHFLQHCTWR